MLFLGWGLTPSDAYFKPPIMKKIEQPVRPINVCESDQKNSRFKIQESMLCVGGELGIDTCAGDAGAPMACPAPQDSTRFVEAGIVSFGPRCGSKTPGIHTNVAYFRSWIDKRMTDAGFGTSYYTL